ncbi:copia protein [Tanacetum coccineum]
MNKALKIILEKTVKDNPAIWSRKLDDDLWAFRTAYKTPTGTTPYKLIYGKNCHFPFEIEHHAYWALKNFNPDHIAAGEKRMFQLHELDELRHQAYENSHYYSEDQYAVSIKEDTAYPCLHSPKTIEDKAQYAVSRGLNTPYSIYEINIIFWKISNVVPTPRNPQYAVSNFMCIHDKDGGMDREFFSYPNWRKDHFRWNVSDVINGGTVGDVQQGPVYQYGHLLTSITILHAQDIGKEWMSSGDEETVVVSCWEQAEECEHSTPDVDEVHFTDHVHGNLTSEEPIYDEAGPLRLEYPLECIHQYSLITPSGLTEGERGFEQTKRCYLTEVIPFFKTLKEHFVGVQTALFKEVKEMEKIFDQMNNEVDQNSVDKQCAEIEKKNLLIENENLIVNCLSTQLLYDVAKSRCLDLEADVSKVHDESKLISKLEREYLNLQLKYQHLQESFDNKKSQASPEAPDFRSFFKIKNLEHQIQEKDNVIGHLKDIVTNVKARSREPYSAVDVTALIEQNNCDRLELEKVKQHYKELFDSIKILRTHTSEKTSTMLNEIESLKAQLRSKLRLVINQELLLATHRDTKCTREFN